MNEMNPHIDARKESMAYYRAEQFAMHTNRPLFITGKAGTGKTTFLRKLREQSPKNMAVVAPTGVAAINAGGMTIHSLFQLPVRTLIPTPQSYKQLFAEQRMSQRKRNMLYHLEMLLIDESSMEKLISYFNSKHCFLWETSPKPRPNWLCLPYILRASGMFLFSDIIIQRWLLAFTWLMSFFTIQLKAQWGQGLCFVHYWYIRHI